MSETGQAHIVAAYSSELSKVERQSIHEHEVNQIFLSIDPQLTARVVTNAGVQLAIPTNPALQPKSSPALNQTNLLSGDIRSRKAAILIADGVAENDVSGLRDVFRQESADAKLITPSASPVQAENGAELIPEETWNGLPSVASDAVFVPGGAAGSQVIGTDGHGLHYLLEAYRHLRPMAFAGDTRTLASQLSLPGDPGVVFGATATDVFPGLRRALMQHRIWQRETAIKAIPA